MNPRDQAEELLRRLDGIDALFLRQEHERDLSEKLAHHAVVEAVEARRVARQRFRTLITVVAAGLLLWTPFLAWGAIWWHQEYLTDCVSRPGLERTVDPAWHCGLFPDTTDQHEDQP